MLRMILKIARIRGDIRAVRGGPKPLAKRFARHAAHRLAHKIIG